MRLVDHVVQRLVYPRLESLVDQQIQSRIEPLVRRTKRVHRHSRLVGESQSALRSQLQELESIVSRQEREIRRLRREQSNAHAQIDSLLVTSELILGRRGRIHDRRVGAEHLSQLEAELLGLVSDCDPNLALAEAMRCLIVAETSGTGRIAGTTQNVLGKLAAIRVLDPPGGEALEIGTLYGLFATSLLRQFAKTGRVWSFTAVDPLSGLQEQPSGSAGDPNYQVPVVPAVFWQNLQSQGFAERSRLVQGRSTDPAIKEAVGDRRYGLIIIDGDHSFDGVLNDLYLAEDVSQPGGIIVVDDYGDRNWPGVNRALDHFLSLDVSLALLGKIATSAILQAPKSE